MIKTFFKQNVDSNYKIPISTTRFQGIIFSRPLNQDIFEKQTEISVNKEYKYPQLFSKPTISFTGSVDEKSVITNPITPAIIASSEEREELKKAIIQSLEKKTFIEGSLINFYEKGYLTKQDILEISTSQAGRIPEKDEEYLIKNKIPLTTVDDEDVLNARLYNLETKELDIKSPSYKQQKPKIIKNEISKMEKIPKNKKMIIILTGLPASGKSTLINREIKDYYLADTDEYLKQFIEYEGGKGTSILHKVASDLLKNHLFPKALDKGVNIVLPTIGWVSYVEEIAKKAQDKGYTVELRHVNIDPEKSIQRTLNRFKETGRLVDPYWINGYNNSLYDKFHIKIEELPKYLKDSSFIDKILLYDNNGAYPEFVRTVKDKVLFKKIKLLIDTIEKLFYNNMQI